MARNSRKPNKRAENRAQTPAVRTLKKLMPPGSDAGLREGAVIVVVLAVTAFVFLGILRTRDDGILSATANSKAEAKREVEKMEQMIQKRLQEMTRKFAAGSGAASSQPRQARESDDGGGEERESDKKRRRQPQAEFTDVDPDAEHPLSAEEMAELQADIHRILGGSDESEQSDDEGTGNADGASENNDV